MIGEDGVWGPEQADDTADLTSGIVVAGGRQTPLRFFSIDTFQQVHYVPDTTQCWEIRFLPDEDTLLSAANRSHLCRMDLTSRQTDITTDFHSNIVRAIMPLGVGSGLFSSCSNDGTCVIRQRFDPTIRTHQRKVGGHIFDLAYDEQSNCLLSVTACDNGPFAHGTGVVSSLDLSTFKLRFDLKIDETIIDCSRIELLSPSHPSFSTSPLAGCLLTCRRDTICCSTTDSQFETVLSLGDARRGNHNSEVLGSGHTGWNERLPAVRRARRRRKRRRTCRGYHTVLTEGHNVIAGGPSGHISCFDVRQSLRGSSGNLVWRIRGHSDELYTRIVSLGQGDNGNGGFVTGSNDGRCHVWNWDGTLKATLIGRAMQAVDRERGVGGIVRSDGFIWSLEGVNCRQETEMGRVREELEERVAWLMQYSQEMCFGVSWLPFRGRSTTALLVFRSMRGD